MAKGTFTWADSPDDPIYNNEFVVSSGTSNPESMQPNENLPTSTNGQDEMTPSNNESPDLTAEFVKGSGSRKDRE